MDGMVDKGRGGSDFGSGLPRNDHVTLIISYRKPVDYLFLIALYNSYRVVGNGGQCYVLWSCFHFYYLKT